jgi:hypothetical protein
MNIYLQSVVSHVSEMQTNKNALFLVIYELNLFSLLLKTI